jgi:arylsulfatase A-like enzyme
MKRTLISCWLTIFSFACVAQNIKNNPKPNIILLMADDMGWGDVGFNGNRELKTPQLDRMAANSLQFTRFYSAAPVCSPTRGSILTGRHPERYGIYSANVGYLKPEELTLAEVLKTIGYRTGHFGKWHLGALSQNLTDTMANNIQQPMPYAPPWMNGFDVCFSTYAQMPTWDPMKAQLRKDYYRDENGNIISDNLEGDDSRIIMDRVIPFMQKSVQEKIPFLALVWFHTPHNPVLAGPEYRNLYEHFDENKQHYYGAITAMDEQIGRLRKEVRRLNIEQNTIVFFTSDNGPATPDEAAGNVAQRLKGTAGPSRGSKFSLYEGGVRVPSLVEWPSLIKKHHKTDNRLLLYYTGYS